MPHAELWAGAIGAWVPLANLLSIIEQETGVPLEEAARVLREPLEDCTIDAEAVAPVDRFKFRDARAYARRIGDPDPDRLSPEDWHQVDWEAGTLGGLPIRLRWADVIQQLRLAGLSLRTRDPGLTSPASQSAATQKAAGRPSGGAPPRHDWDAFWIEVALYAAKHDLDSGRRRDLQQHMVEWAQRELPDPPDDATIRTRLKRLFQRVPGNRSEPSWPSR